MLKKDTRMDGVHNPPGPVAQMDETSEPKGRPPRRPAAIHLHHGIQPASLTWRQA